MPQLHEYPAALLDNMKLLVEKYQETIKIIDDNSVYYHFQGKGLPEDFYFKIISKENRSGGMQYLIDRYPVDGVSATGARHNFYLDGIQKALDIWIELIKRYQRHAVKPEAFEPETKPEIQIEAVPEDVKESERTETFESLMEWAIGEGLRDITDENRAEEYYELRPRFLKYVGEQKLTADLMRKFLQSPKSIIKKSKWKRYGKPALGWFLGIIGTLFAAYLKKRFGW